MLKLLDCRDVTTNKGMFDSCIQHLAKAVSSVLDMKQNIHIILLHTDSVQTHTTLNADVVWFIGSIHHRF